MHEADNLLVNSRITPNSNGSGQPVCTPPTSGQKWWAAVIIGFVFAIISSPPAYYITSHMTTSLGGLPTIYGAGPSIPGLLLHTAIFILVVRLILW